MITTIIEREAEPILISDLTWREFKAVEQLIDRTTFLIIYEKVNLLFGCYP